MCTTCTYDNDSLMIDEETNKQTKELPLRLSCRFGLKHNQLWSEIIIKSKGRKKNNNNKNAIEKLW